MSDGIFIFIIEEKFVGFFSSLLDIKKSLFLSSLLQWIHTGQKKNSIRSCFFFLHMMRFLYNILKQHHQAMKRNFKKKKRFCNLKAILPNLVKCSFCSKTHIIFVWDSPIQYSLSSTTKIYKIKIISQREWKWKRKQHQLKKSTTMMKWISLIKIHIYNIIETKAKRPTHLEWIYFRVRRVHAKNFFAKHREILSSLFILFNILFIQKRSNQSLFNKFSRFFSFLHFNHFNYKQLDNRHIFGSGYNSPSIHLSVHSILTITTSRYICISVKVD